MQKVIYSITRLGKNGNKKITGIGYITDEDLITAGISKNGNAYIRPYSCVKNCFPVIGTTDEFKGTYYEIVEIEVEKDNSYETREISVNYYVWYKIAKD